MTRPPGNQERRWDSAKDYPPTATSKQPSITAVNQTGTEQDLVLLVFKPSSPLTWTMVAYHPLKSGHKIVTPTDLQLQAYVVDVALDYDFIVLQPKDLQRPLFPTPINCNDLPADSRWRLSQARNGELRLKNDLNPHLGFRPSNDAITATIAAMESRVSTLEKSVAYAQAGVARGQQSIDDIQLRLTVIEKSAGQPHTPTAYGPGIIGEQRLSEPDSRIPALETQTSRLATSLGQTQDYLSSVQAFLQSTRSQISVLDGKIPTIEAKTEQLIASSTSTGDQLATIDHRITSLEMKTGKLTEALEEIRESGEEDTSITFPGRFTELSLSGAPARPSGEAFPTLPERFTLPK